MSSNELEIRIFESSDCNIKFEVNIKDETVWLSVKEMSELFSKDETTIRRHIKNIYNTQELDVSSTRAKNARVEKIGTNYFNDC